MVTRREATPIVAFLARIFGYDSFALTTEAVAYLGFAGTLEPLSMDQPIAICKQSLSDPYSCNIGRMINSGQDLESHETGGWTDFNQEGDPCHGGTNANTVKGLVCGEGNPRTIYLGENMATQGGEVQAAFDRLMACWIDNSENKTKPWNMTLPVIDCLDDSNVGPCNRVVCAVNVNIIWINRNSDPHYKDVPTRMDGLMITDEEGNEHVLYEPWSCSADNETGRIRCWTDFVNHFHLKNVDGSPAPYEQKSIYFLPDCTPHEPVGVSGGENYGILAKYPVLVK